MTSVSYLLIIAVLLVSDCYCQSILISSQSIDVNNEHPSLQHNSWIDTLTTTSQLNPSLVQGLTSPLTTTSYNVFQDSLSSMDYLPLVKPTMSSAYSGFKNDTKSTESVLMNSLNSSDLPLSIQGANQFSKHLTNDQVLESSVGSWENFLTDFENNQMKTIENGFELSRINSDQPTAVDEFQVSSAENVWPTGTIFTPELNSITHSIDVYVSSISLSIETDDFRANTFDVTNTSQVAYFNTLLEPSEWRKDIFPSVAYDEALISDFSISNTLEYDYGIYDMETVSIQSDVKEEFSSSISVVSSMESDNTLIPPSSREGITLSSTEEHSMQNLLLESIQTIWSQTETIPFSQDYLIPFLSESFPPISSHIPSEIVYSSSIPREITLDSTSVGVLNKMSSYSDILTYPVTSLTSNDTLSSSLTSSMPITTRSILSPTTTDIPTTTTDMPTTTTDMPTSTTAMSNTTTALSTTTSITTTTGKIVFKDCRFLFKFSGDCHLIINNTLYLAEFIEGLRKTLVETLHISNDRMKPHDISCGSIKIYVTFKNVSYPEFKSRLEYAVKGRNFIVPTYIENVVVTFTALSVEEVALPPRDVDSSDLPKRGIDNIDIIVIIVACCVCGILIVIGITVCVKECYKRKYAQSFDLLDMPHVNLKLEDFTLTRIPRPKTNYNTDNVTANPYTDRYNQQTKKENGQNVSNGNHIDLKDVHVRMQPLKNEGIVVGVTGYTSANGAPRKKKRAPSASSRQSNEDHLHGDPSTESLVPETNSSSMGASNPIFVDDEQGSTSTLDVNRSYHS